MKSGRQSFGGGMLWIGWLSGQQATATSSREHRQGVLGRLRGTWQGEQGKNNVAKAMQHGFETLSAVAQHQRTQGRRQRGPSKTDSLGTCAPNGRAFLQDSGLTASSKLRRIFPFFPFPLRPSVPPPPCCTTGHVKVCF